MDKEALLKIGIVGAAGYTGGELIRLLLNHPKVQLVWAQSRSQAGKPFSSAHPDLLGETDQVFVELADLEAVDLVFLCLAHGDSKLWLEQQIPSNKLKIIDLSNDFRAGGTWGDRAFVYGLPERNRSEIQSAGLVANPGCFATALQLALLPLALAGKLEDAVYATGITGATGGGQALSETAHFPWRHANVSAYKTLTHQHIAEVRAGLRIGGNPAPLVHFVPWRGDFARGIYISATLPCALSQQEVLEIFQKAYASHPFTIVHDDLIDLKMAVNTNKCVLFPEKQDDMLVVHAAIDNLLKGASGQAVQNMNLMMGWPESTGLHLKASAF